MHDVAAIGWDLTPCLVFSWDFKSVILSVVHLKFLVARSEFHKSLMKTSLKL